MTTERRSHPRTHLRVPLFLLPKGSTVPIRTETEDLSMEGFYCYTEHRFLPGECLQFVMLLPPATRNPLTLGGLCLQGCVQVVRFTLTSDARYGMGCHLKEYRVLPNPELLTPEFITSTLLASDQQTYSTSST